MKKKDELIELADAIQLLSSSFHKKFDDYLILYVLKTTLVRQQ